MLHITIENNDFFHKIVILLVFQITVWENKIKIFISYTQG